MTDNCTTESEKLEGLLRCYYLDGVTTEIMLHSWIMLNDAEDIYDCLLMMVKDSDNKHYNVAAREKLGILKERLKNANSNETE